jgi:hypothetical protein
LRSLSLFDGAVHKLWDGTDTAISPDGAKIAYVVPESDIWMLENF